MSRQLGRFGFFKNKFPKGSGTAFVPEAFIGREFLSNTLPNGFGQNTAPLTLNVEISTNLNPNTTIGYKITGNVSSTEFYGGLTGNVTLDSNSNATISITSNVSPDATDGLDKTFAVNVTNPSHATILATGNSHTLTGTPGPAIQFIPQGNYSTTDSGITVSSTAYTLQRMDYDQGNIINSSTDPRGFTTNTIREQKYLISANQDTIALDMLVIGGGGSAAYSFNARDSGGGGGGAQVTESSANVTTNAIYDFEIGSNGRYTWLFDNGGDTSFTYWSTGISGQISTAFANSSYSASAREGKGAQGQGVRGGSNGGDGWAAGGGGGAGALFLGGTPNPGRGGRRYGQANTAPTPTANANVSHGGSGDDGNSTTFTGSTVFYGAGGSGAGAGALSNGSDGNGINNYGSGGTVKMDGAGNQTITDSQPGVIYIRHSPNGTRRIVL